MKKSLFIGLLIASVSAKAAILYVSSVDGDNTDTGLTWALSKADIQGAVAAAVAGDTIYIDPAHAGTTNGILNIVFPGTAAAPCIVACASRSAEPPTTLATTAIIATSGANGLAINGFAYIYGIIFNCGTGASSANLNPLSATTSGWLKFDSCSLRLVNTHLASRIILGVSSTSQKDGFVQLVNTTVSFANVGQGIVPRTRFEWLNTSSAVLGSVPTILFTPFTGTACETRLIGVDLSALTSGKNWVDIGQTAVNSLFNFLDCKRGASVSLTTGNAIGQGGTVVRAVNCDSADTTYNYYFSSYQGTVTDERIIVRTGGALEGITPVSRKMVTTANSKLYSPLESDPITFYNASTNSQTVKIAVVTDGVTLTDADAWIRVEEQGTSGFPQAVFVSDKSADIMATPANQTTDTTSTWTTTGLASPIKQQLNVTFTAAHPGVVRARIMLARPITTMYADLLAIIQ